jgi:hypothetical protein
MYTVDMASGVMIYVHTKFHNDWFRHSKLDGMDNADTQNGDFISLLLRFRTRESRLEHRDREVDDSVAILSSLLTYIHVKEKTKVSLNS